MLQQLQWEIETLIFNFVFLCQSKGLHSNKEECQLKSELNQQTIIESLGLIRGRTLVIQTMSITMTNTMKARLKTVATLFLNDCCL
jgi:hypothetical protein